MIDILDLSGWKFKRIMDEYAKEKSKGKLRQPEWTDR